MPYEAIDPIAKVCPECGTTFEVGGRGRPPKRQVYCSHRCHMLARPPLEHPGSNAPRPKKNRDTLHNEGWLRQRYLIDRLSTVEIARMTDCAVPSVVHALEKFGIARFGQSEAKTGRTIRAVEISGTAVSSVDRARERNALAMQALKLEMIAGYGGKCACCGETEPAFLTLDHVNGGGQADRKKVGSRGVYQRLRDLGWPRDGYRLLCMNCNLATKFGRTCPHQVARQDRLKEAVGELVADHGAALDRLAE